MSQEQTDRVEQPVLAEESDASVAPLASGTPTPDSASSDQMQASQEGATTTGTQPKKNPTGRKRARGKGRLVNAEEVMPRPSLWPLGMAFSLAFVLFGVIAGPVVLGIGIVLLVVSGAGWALERR
ncbi:hypothetical protein [Dictyobacter kobayashii]|uniref:Cytochrome aa3 subunit 4 n=1 Tax=Dictyobacter kobayashii TaxID=2014872 RepID=A0A402AG45_9CHLR|nr:hypothetical protein [Dictyobacter kobayashii]GCE18091.1 hypothetical protein KDK_18910 [Dictyobacter kobayashii]